MGTIESADTSSNDFRTNTASAGIPSQAASIGIDKGPKIHSNSKIIEHIH